MLTIFTIPKPFHGHIEIIQRNAIRSWLNLNPAFQIILCGDDTGTEQVAAELGVDFLPAVERNTLGTPLLNSVFKLVGEKTKHNLLCYLNTDIILLGNLVKAVRNIEFSKFLMVGQRWDIDLATALDFRENWQEQLRRYVVDKGTLHSPYGIDFFVFQRTSKFTEIPPFAVGRPGWDGWFIYNARRHRIPVIDATKAITIAHQNHDYAHVPDRRGDYYEGPEADENRTLMGGMNYAFSISDATYLMTADMLLQPKHGSYASKVADSLRMLIIADLPNSRVAPAYKLLRKGIRAIAHRVPGLRTLLRFFPTLASKTWQR